MIPCYDFEQPTAEELAQALRGVVGPADADAAIGIALRELDPPSESLDNLSSAQLLQVAQAMARQRGLVAIIGRSFAIRMTSYLELAEARS